MSIVCDCGHRGYFYIDRILPGRVDMRCPKCGTVTECETIRRPDHKTEALPFKPIRTA